MRFARFGLSTACVVFLLASGDSFAQAPTRQGSASGDDQQLTQVHQQLLDAAQRRDVAATMRLLADGAMWVRTNGEVAHKAELGLALPAAPRAVNVERIRPLGKAAVVTGVARFESGRQDERFLQEWVKEGGQWKLLTHQATSIAPSDSTAVGTAGSASSASRPTDGPARARDDRGPALHSDEERAVWKTEQELTDAYLRGDVATYTKFTAHEFSLIGPDGDEQPKYDFLKTVVAENARHPGGRLSTRDVTIAVHGDTAQVAMVAWGILPGGEEFPPTRVTRIYQKRQGVWLQTAAIFTRVAEP